MPTNYPGSLDSWSNPTGTTYMDDTGFYHDEVHANLNDAVEAIESELGITPSADFNTVAARLASIESDVAGVTAHPAPYVAVSVWTGTGGSGSYAARPSVQAGGFVIFDSSTDIDAPPPSSSSITGGGSPSARDEWKTLRTD